MGIRPEARKQREKGEKAREKQMCVDSKFEFYSVNETIGATAASIPMQGMPAAKLFVESEIKAQTNPSTRPNSDL